MPLRFIVPPGGFAGFNNMTSASRAALNGAGTRTASPRRRRRKGSAKKAKARARTRKGSSRKMKFGSPAWQKKYKVGKYRR